jgi:hypothetical protein
MAENINQEIRAYLDERRLISTHLEVMEPSYQWVSTEIRFHPTRSQEADIVKQRIEDTLHKFLNPLTGGARGEGWQFGRDLYKSDVMAVLLAVPGVEFIRSVQLIPVNYDEASGVFSPETDVDSIPLVAYGVIASYRHNAVHG